jgi:hypothetical protein
MGTLRVAIAACSTTSWTKRSAGGTRDTVGQAHAPIEAVERDGEWYPGALQIVEVEAAGDDLQRLGGQIAVDGGDGRTDGQTEAAGRLEGVDNRMGPGPPGTLGASLLAGQAFRAALLLGAVASRSIRAGSRRHAPVKRPGDARSRRPSRGSEGAPCRARSRRSPYRKT